MLSGYIGGLFLAWVLKAFHANDEVITIIQPFFDNFTINDTYYYIIFGLAGAIGGAFKSRVTQRNGDDK